MRDSVRRYLELAMGADGLAAAELTSVAHSHAEYVGGCFRCDLGRDEVAR